MVQSVKPLMIVVVGVFSPRLDPLAPRDDRQAAVPKKTFFSFTTPGPPITSGSSDHCLVIVTLFKLNCLLCCFLHSPHLRKQKTAAQLNIHKKWFFFFAFRAWHFFGGVEARLQIASEKCDLLVWYIKQAFCRIGNHSSNSSASVNKSHNFSCSEKLKLKRYGSENSCKPTECYQVKIKFQWLTEMFYPPQIALFACVAVVAAGGGGGGGQ